MEIHGEIESHYSFGGKIGVPKKKPVPKMTWTERPQVIIRLENCFFLCCLQLRGTGPKVFVIPLGFQYISLVNSASPCGQVEGPRPPSTKKNRTEKGAQIIRVSFCLCFHAFFVCLLSFKRKILYCEVMVVWPSPCFCNGLCASQIFQRPGNVFLF